MEQSNITGTLGEQLASELIPSGTLQPSTGFDMVGVEGSKIEVKCSRYSESRGGWRFRVKRAQIETCDWLLLLALDPDGLLCSYWLIPGDSIRSREIVINELNLADYAPYLVEVISDKKIKFCGWCKTNKKLEEFGTGKIKTICLTCLPKYTTSLQKSHRKEYNHNYYLEHKEKLLIKNRAWSKANRRSKEAMNAYREAHKEEINRARRAKWRFQHPTVQRTRRAN